MRRNSRLLGVPGGQFGEEGVADIVNNNPDMSAQQLVDEIMRAARHHGGVAPQADDITIVLVKRSRE